jgi:hypothetical protein
MMGHNVTSKIPTFKNGTQEISGPTFDTYQGYELVETGHG